MKKFIGVFICLLMVGVFAENAEATTRTLTCSFTITCYSPSNCNGSPDNKFVDCAYDMAETCFDRYMGTLTDAWIHNIVATEYPGYVKYKYYTRGTCEF